MRIRPALPTCAVAALLIATPAAAQRADTVAPARLMVASQCPLTSSNATQAEWDADQRESLFGAALLGAGAKLVGDLAGGAINALGEALVAASAEHGFVAQGATHFQAYTLTPAPMGEKVARLQGARVCAILYVPGAADWSFDAPRLADLQTRAKGAGQGFQIFDDNAQSRKEARDRLTALGITKAPALYVEAHIWSATDGVVFRPVLVWYESPLPGAPNSATPVELHVTLATPAAATNAAPIGSAFAVSQIKLPPMSPATDSRNRAPKPGAGVLVASDLAGYGVVAMPARPATGAAEASLTAANRLYTEAATAGSELRLAQTAERAALRARDRAKPDQLAQAEETLTVAREVVALKQATSDTAELAAAGLDVAKVGTTNIQVSFVAIRDANKFGLMVGNALKARKDDINTAVKDALTPKPPTAEWLASDTAYITAMNNVAVKQRELDGLTDGADAAAAATAAAARATKTDELLVLKARANEAAVTAQRDLPFPGLLPPR